MKICALIPAYNEADVIAGIVTSVRRRVSDVVVVDDGSSDDTRDRAAQAGAICLRLEQNLGKGSALRYALATIRAHDFTHVLFMDGDGQHRPEDIRALTRVACDTGADLVIGCRMFHRQVMPRSRHFSNTVGSRLASRLVGQPVRDSQSGFRLARLASLRKLALRSTRYEFEMEVLIKMSRAGCRIAQAPISTVYDGHTPRSKMKPIRDTIRICLWSLWFRFAAR